MVNSNCPFSHRTPFIRNATSRVEVRPHCIQPPHAGRLAGMQPIVHPSAAWPSYSEVYATAHSIYISPRDLPSSLLQTETLRITPPFASLPPPEIDRHARFSYLVDTPAYCTACISCSRRVSISRQNRIEMHQSAAAVFDQSRLAAGRPTAADCHARRGI